MADSRIPSKRWQRALPCLLLLAACGGEDQPADPDAGQVLESPAAGTPGGTAGAARRLPQNFVRFDFMKLEPGSLLRGTRYEAEFPFTVSAERPVTITGVTPCCAFGEATLWVDGAPWPANKPIPAGARGKVTAPFRVDAKRDSKIYVNLEGFRQPVTLDLECRIQPIYDIQPPRARFGKVAAGTAAERTLRVEGHAPFEVLEWALVPPGLSVEEVSTEGADAEGRALVRVYRVALAADAPEGPVAPSIAARTNLAKPLVLRIDAMVVGPVQVAPRRLVNFSIVPAGIEHVRPVVLTAELEGFPLPLPEFALSGDPAFRCRLADQVPGKSCRLEITLAAEAAAGRHEGVLRLVFPDETGLPPRELQLLAIVKDG